MISVSDNSQILLDRIATVAVTKFAAALTLPRLVQRWADGQQGSNPDKYLVPKITELSANTFDEKSGVTPQDVSTANIEVTTKTFESTFRMSAEAMASGLGERENAFLNEAIQAVKRAVETEMLKSVATDGGITLATGTLGTDLSYAQLAATKKALDEQEAGDVRHLILHPESDANLQADTDVKALGVNSQPDNIASGRVPRLQGFNIYVSPRVHVPSAGQYSNLAFVPSAISTVFPNWAPARTQAIQISVQEMDGIRMGVAMEVVPGTLGGVQMTAFCKFGAKLVNPNGLVHVRG